MTTTSICTNILEGQLSRCAVAVGNCVHILEEDNERVYNGSGIVWRHYYPWKQYEGRVNVWPWGGIALKWRWCVELRVEVGAVSRARGCRATARRPPHSGALKGATNCWSSPDCQEETAPLTGNRRTRPQTTPSARYLWKHAFFILHFGVSLIQQRLWGYVLWFSMKTNEDPKQIIWRICRTH